MIKLIASDLDGTIINANDSIPEANIKVINALKDKNIPLVICTGKTYSMSKNICKNLNATFGVFAGGSQIVDLRTGKEISKKVLSFDEISSCISHVQKYNLHIHAYTEDSIITTTPLYMDLRNSILFPNQIKFEIVDSVFNFIKGKNLPILKLIVSSPFSLDNIQKELEDSTSLNIAHIFKSGIYKDNIINKEYEYLDISPREVTKGNALNFLKNYLHLENNSILSIGDNLNDTSMFDSSFISIAVSNAHEDVKKIADYTTLNSAENGGFAEGIYKFISF